MKLAFWLRHPGLVLARVRYWVWERRNPDKPWLTPGAVLFLEAALTPDMTAVEFGSGRSTGWFAARVGRLTSVEHHRGWYDKVAAVLAASRRANVDYRHVPLDHPEAEPERPGYDPLPAYVRVLDDFADGSVDLVVVDGHYRSACTRAAAAKLKPGGLLLVDDVNMWAAGPPVPAGWAEASRTTNGLKTTGVWRKPA